MSESCFGWVGVSVCGGRHDGAPWPGMLTLTSHSSGGLVSSEAGLLCLPVAVFLLCPHPAFLCARFPGSLCVS